MYNLKSLYKFVNIFIIEFILNHLDVLIKFV